LKTLLSSKAANSYRIIAVTRSIKSKSAQALASRGITLVEGDLDHVGAIFEKTGPVWGVFSVQVASHGTNQEEIQGKAIIDAAISSGVSHFVYASGDRGGPIRSPEDPTVVANLAAKFNIEKHLEKSAPLTGMSYTILRPVTFLENLSTDRHGLGFARLWEQIGSDKPLQVVSTRDVGWFGAQALMNPDEWKGKAISLAGDALTQSEANVIFKEVMGKDMPIAPCLVGTALKYIMKEEVGVTFQWLAEAGWNADVEQCRSIYPEMQDFRSWLKQSSDFVKK
jgi:uncharacterized protein YbjT (DUF2867 family)